MPTLDFMIWNASPEIFTLLGREVRWYGLLFALSFLLSQQILVYIYKKEGKPPKDIDTLTVYVVLATIIGARLGHVFFYEADKYLADPIEIFMIWKGGLASHGAGIAIIFSLWLYSRKKKKGQNFLQVLDRIAITVALAAALIRFGNFMNSEIYGHTTNSGSGIVYAREVSDMLTNKRYADIPAKKVDYSKDSSRENIIEDENTYVPITITLAFDKRRVSKENLENYLKSDTGLKEVLISYSNVRDHIYQENDQVITYRIEEDKREIQATISTYGKPRYPTQLYESSSYFLLFIFLFFVWTIKKKETPSGRIFGLFMILLFTLRFFHEFLKVNQVAFEENIPLNMGQWLSIPFVIVGIFVLARSFRKKQQVVH